MAASATTLDGEKARLAQALEDLNTCRGVGVSLVRCPSHSKETLLARELAAVGRKRRFTTATVSLAHAGLQAPDALLREVLAKLVSPGGDKPGGLLGLLDDFRSKHRRDAAGAFRAAAEAQDAAGDLTALCASYLAAPRDSSRATARAYRAWCRGEEPSARGRVPGVRRPLSERSAQRALHELTRLICALGHRGLLLLLTEGDTLAQRTDRQREKAYTVLRELVDNLDTAGGAVATKLLITGGDALFAGRRSIQEVAPLRMRLEVPSEATPPPPHRSWVTLDEEAPRAKTRRAAAVPDARARSLRSLIRVSEGLPPEEGITEMSVGQERLDKTVRNLFRVVERSGSFFSVLAGEYGSGKTHVMMHLAERALEDRRPVFWLNLERTNLDLGNPARHLGRLLSHSQLPARGRPSALALAARWTRTASKRRALRAALGAIIEEDGPAALAARKALRVAEHAEDPDGALESHLAGSDLVDRPGDPAYRLDAYRRLHLWFELLARIEEVRGPVLLIDEAENLYSSGLSPAQRRTALRSLSFYCGGSLPRACVIMAMTPPAFEELKREARLLLEEANQLGSTLALENVGKFRRSLWGLKPDPIRPLSRPERVELCERVIRMHRAARGSTPALPNLDAHIRAQVATHTSPRSLIRGLVDELEARWWRTTERDT